ncbi:hypothetical protein AN958_10682 [Leucoagaricus sp. SymC.cos]|nr:hypothetical protein AN958_10682 [Leucoagaricus sp. SymC.cos]
MLTSQGQSAVSPNQTFGRTFDLAQDESRTEVMAMLLDQHPNMSVFHNSTMEGSSTNPSFTLGQLQGPVRPIPPNPSPFSQPQPSPPPSPSKRSLFKRVSKDTKDPDSVRGTSSLKLLPKKIRGSLPFGNGMDRSAVSSAQDLELTLSSFLTASQSSLTSPTVETADDASAKHKPQRSQDTIRSFANIVRRPSVDILRSATVQESTTPLDSPVDNYKTNSVRSILRDPNTPGTGQNVRFFSHDVYKVISPEESTEENFLSPPSQVRVPDPTSFTDWIGPNHSSSPITRSPPRSKPRPSLSAVFGPLESSPNNNHPAKTESNAEPMFSSGLSFDVGSPLLDSAIDLDLSISGTDSEGRMTSTPFRPRSAKSKGKEREESIHSFKEEEEETVKRNVVLNGPANGPRMVDETIFHAKERQPVFSPPLHERSQSFSFGQTVFYSTGTISEKPSPSAPEADINDDSSQGVILYSTPSASEPPDPFNANARTYYTPQTMIPTTPPGVPRHTRKTSKEENLIYSLKTQLTLQTELCSQYEADLRTKDEMVELLSKKLADLEKQENQRKGALRQWKKKVQDLERAVRLLEEEVDGSRQESMERSVMDEASGEALRMLHQQIASFEMEKKEWVGKEKTMKSEVERLEVLVKERSQDVLNLKEMLWTKDESESELDKGLREAKEQIDMLGNASLVGIDEEELRRLAEREQEVNEERQAYRVAEMNWNQEREELMMKLESMQVEKANVQDELETLKQQFENKEDEFEVMKNELEAQWGHTENASDKIRELTQAKKQAEEDIAKARSEKEEAVQERDELAQKCEVFEQQMNELEMEWNETGNRKHQLEAEVHELWDQRDEMEKEREQLEKQLVEERDHSEELTRALHECGDRIAELEQEQQSFSDRIAELKETIRDRDDRIAQHSQKLRARELESENLHDEIAQLKRDHEQVINELNEHSRALKDATGSESEARRQFSDLIRLKSEVEGELKTTKENMNSLKNEMERLRKHVHDLQQESADKEVKVVQLTKQHGKDKEDIQGLNIALDAKQQELELYKRKNGIKAGSTPASTSSSSKTLHRRDSSSLFDGTTPASTRPPSRAMSVTSDSGSTKGEGKITALGKSNRINTSSSTSTTGSVVKKAHGSMGPPPVKKLPSSLSAGTPTPAPVSRPTASATSRINCTYGPSESCFGEDENGEFDESYVEYK